MRQGGDGRNGFSCHSNVADFFEEKNTSQVDKEGS